MQKLDSFVFGLFTGLAGGGVGMFIYYLLQFHNMDFKDFIVFAKQPSILSPLISLGAIFDLGLFFLYLNRHWAKASRGVIFSLFIFVIMVAILKMKGG